MDSSNTARRKILEAALDAFSRKGYEAVGVQELVEAAGVSKPTLYYYFSSKLGLLEMLLEEGGAELEANFEEHCRYDHDLTGNLMALAGAFFSSSRDNAAFTRLVLALSWLPLESETFEVVRAFQKRFFHSLESLFLAAEEDHGNMRGRSYQYATSFLGIIQTYAGMIMDGRIEFTDELPHAVVHQFMHGIFS